MDGQEVKVEVKEDRWKTDEFKLALRKAARITEPKVMDVTPNRGTGWMSKK